MRLVSVTFILSFWITGIVAPSYFAITSEENVVHWTIEKHEKEQKESEEKDTLEVDIIFPTFFNVKLVSLQGLNLAPDNGALGIRDFSIDIILPPPEHLG
ncbi:MAG: hypothetical protein HKN89_01700 [Eudoraea sp.]|nr:hypothetical protein [Eudoraea sp.]